MLTVLSPAKKLDWSAPPIAVETGTPAFQQDAVTLAETARRLGPDGLKALMHISDKLAALNQERFEAFAPAPPPDATRPAIFAFNGDTYTGLEARTLDADALDFASRHLRILSGLYGVLRPFDAMQAYRLEMGSRLKTARGAALYDYWGDRIAQALNDAGREAGTEVLINCASQEYFGAVDRAALRLRVITPVFLDQVGEDKPKVISFHAKKARGAMARFILERRLTEPDAITEFGTGGYCHAPELSTPDAPAFLRQHPARN
ncbi:MAG: peroxide stress protein YaaA [Roseinatronobacter sp.]